MSDTYMSKLIIDAETMSRMMKRMTHEIMEKNKTADDVILVGIKRRGAYLAERIALQMEELYGDIPVVQSMDISNFRDDREPSGLPTGITVDLTDKIVIIVDDVLFTGRTIRAALDAIINHGRPQRIQLLTFVDRGHREYPIRPDYVGKNLPTSRSEIIDLHITELDGEDGIYLSKI